MRSKSKKFDWIRNSFLGNTPISLELLIGISQNLAQKYLKKYVTVEVNFKNEILDFPVNLQIIFNF